MDVGLTIHFSPRVEWAWIPVRSPSFGKHLFEVNSFPVLFLRIWAISQHTGDLFSQYYGCWSHCFLYMHTCLVIFLVRRRHQVANGVFNQFHLKSTSVAVPACISLRYHHHHLHHSDHHSDPGPLSQMTCTSHDTVNCNWCTPVPKQKYRIYAPSYHNASIRQVWFYAQVARYVAARRDNMHEVLLSKKAACREGQYPVYKGKWFPSQVGPLKLAWSTLFPSLRSHAPTSIYSGAWCIRCVDITISGLLCCWHLLSVASPQTLSRLVSYHEVVGGVPGPSFWPISKCLVHRHLQPLGLCEQSA